MKDDGILGVLALQFVIMSLLAFGGANAVVPEIHRQAVELGGWMNDREFADLLAIAQVAPGPNVMLVTLVGYHVAGFSGALVATLAMCGPTAILAAFLGRAWEGFREKHWRKVVQAGLVPISVGLVAAGGIVFVGIAANSWISVAIMIVTAAVAYFTKINPLWLFGIAVAMGIVGWV